LIEDAWAASIEEPPCRNAFQSGFVLFAFLLFYFSLVIGSRQFEVDVDFKFGIRMGGYPFVWHQIKVLLSHFLQSAFLRSSSLCRIFNIVVSAGPATETPSRPPGKTPGVFGKFREKSTKSRKNLGLLSAVYPSQSGNNVPVKAYRQFLASGVWTLT
jgi:hypothetical protein